MTTPDQDEFVRIVKSLGPYWDQLVVVGAWCHRLLRFHPLAAPPSFVPLMTEDADVGMPERLPARSPSIGEALTSGGFRPSFSGDGPVPVTRYFPEGDDRGMYVEFIAPLRGSGYTRAGEPDDILEAAGITAQKLRYVELLLHEPWQLEVSADRGFDVGQDKLVIQVANPASYLAQKVLTLRRRIHGRKQSKDALYIHDTLTMFGDSFSELREQGAKVLELLPARTRNTFHELRVELFRDTSLMIRAAEIAAATGRASPPSVSTIAAVCSAGLEQVFSPAA